NGGAAGATGARDPYRLLLGGVFAPGCRDGDQRFHLHEALLPDTAHVHQLLDLFEPSVLLAVFHDALGRLRADPGSDSSCASVAVLRFTDPAADATVLAVTRRSGSWAPVVATPSATASSATVMLRAIVPSSA